MNVIRIFTVMALVGLAAQTANAQLIDDFSGDLSNYTQTVLLDVNEGPSNATVFEISNGGLQVNTAAFDAIEQIAFVYDGLSLNVGDEVIADIQHSGNQDLGLFVGGVAPTAGVRSTFVTSHSRNAGQVLSAAFDGDDGGTTTGFGTTNPGHDSLFIRRTGVNEYEAGSFAGDTRVIDATYTDLTVTNDASFVGFYADVRAAGVLGTVDNLRVVRAVPEPSSIGLLGMSACLFVVRRRRK